MRTARLQPVARGARLVKLVERHPVRSVLAVALLVRIVVALVVFLTHGGSLFFDDANYQALSTKWLDHTLGRTDPFEHTFFRENWAYLYPISAGKWLLGGSALGAQLVVVAVGAGTAAMVTLLALETLPRRWATATGLAVALFPSLVLWSSLALKDPFVWLLCATLAYAFVRERSAVGWRASAGWFALSVAVLCTLEGVRIYTFTFAILSLVVACALVPASRRIPRTAVALLLAFALPIAFGQGPFAIDVIRKKPPSEQRALNAQQAQTAVVPPVLIPEGAQERLLTAEELLAAARERARLAELQRKAEAARLRAEAEALAEAKRRAEAEAKLVRGGFRENLEYLPKGVGLMLLQPYLWNISSNGSVRAAALEHVLWYPTLALALVGLLAVWSRRRVLLLPLLLGGGALLVTALGEGNFGTAYRHRSDLVWVVILLAGAGASLLAERYGRRPGASGPAAPDDDPALVSAS